MTTSIGRRAAAMAVAFACAVGLSATTGQPANASGSARAATASTRPNPLTNLDHLDWLGARIPLRPVAGHTTYDVAAEPRAQALWVYANHNADGTYTRVGGGAYDATTNTYSQGAYDADDIARAAVVYLRDWTQTGQRSSRQQARQLLRTLTYLQTSTGPNAGNVVLWMQPDGTLNPSAIPKDQPDPSDSANSYWLARTIWALGEGYADFRTADPSFANFLSARLRLAVGALDRDSLRHYGTYLMVDGRRTPAWLITGGADASGEALLGLAAYVHAGGGGRARGALTELAGGVAAMQGGGPGVWPFGAILPAATSRSMWHAWGGLAPAGLTRAGLTVGRRGWVRDGAVDSDTFTPWLLTAGGPDNGLLPTPVDQSQIAYGVDSRVESALASADALHSRGPEEVAGLVAAWFFGANPAGVPVYDPATGTTVDGIAADGTINLNAGAESTIHTELTMLALDAHPLAARIALLAATSSRDGLVTVQAEDGVLTGGATTVTPPSLWTGESQYGGTGYVHVPTGGSVTISVPGGAATVVLPVINFQHGSRTVVSVCSSDRTLGRIHVGAVGPSGQSAAPGALLPATLPRDLPAGNGRTITLTAHGGGADIDAVMVEPVVDTVVHSAAGNGVELATNPSARTRTLRIAGVLPAAVEMFDGAGAPRAAFTVTHARAIRIPAGRYAIITSVPAK